VLAPGGTLATSPASAPKDQALSVVEQTFIKGDALAPKPGRADDFAWPPH
jgi:hypothetical protein